MVGERKDPYRQFRFLLEIDGIVQAGFSEVTIPDTTSDVVEYREGNELTTVRKLPGLTKYGNVTLKWGITDSLELYENWRKPVEDGKMADARKNVAIILMDEEGSPAARWEFVEAWPSKYDAPDLNAKGTDVAVETLEVVHEGMKRVKP
ncbi:MAG: phage tail protein [Candidatus Methanospirareceae archaeon]|jgi:phage tail-like protein